MTGKYLYCEKCKAYPDRIKEVYQEPITETRVWDGECYELKTSNIEEAEYQQLCGKCGSGLKEKSAEPSGRKS